MFAEFYQVEGQITHNGIHLVHERVLEKEQK